MSDGRIQTNSDLSVIAPNANGNDFVIGDLHGNRRVLKSALKRINENDRLFLVGDLTDRGKDSIGVIRLIVETNAKQPGKICVIKGNHEELAINCIQGLEKIAKILQGRSEEEFKQWVKTIQKTDSEELIESYGYDPEIDDIKLHLKNGGAWLVEAFWKELNQLDENGKPKISINESGGVTYNENSDVKMVLDFMSNLPYMNYVEGNNEKVPFILGHADIPFSDQEVIEQAEIVKNGGVVIMKPEDRKYVTWAREGGDDEAIQDKGRSRESMVAFVGHSIVAEGKAPPIRRNTNTVDLDVASYKHNICALFCATTGDVRFVGTGVEKARNHETLQKVQQELKTYGNEFKILREMYVALKQCHSAEAVKGALEAAVEKINQAENITEKLNYAQVLRYALNNGVISDKLLHDLKKLEFASYLNEKLAEKGNRMGGKEINEIVQKWSESVGISKSELLTYAAEKGIISLQQKRQAEGVRRFRSKEKGFN